MNYQVQIMDTDFNTVEFNVTAKSADEAKTIARKGIKPEDISLIAVFEEGSNISLPINPVDSYDLTTEDITMKQMTALTYLMVSDHPDVSTMESLEADYGVKRLCDIIHGRDHQIIGSCVGLMTETERGQLWETEMGFE